MPLFIVFGNWTDEGFKNAKDAPSRIKNTHKKVTDLGGKMQLRFHRETVEG